MAYNLKYSGLQIDSILDKANHLPSTLGSNNQVLGMDGVNIGWITLPTKVAEAIHADSATTADSATAATNADSATVLATSRTIQTNLASASAASFNGSANVAPGVIGVLPITNGGTGLNTIYGANVYYDNGGGDVSFTSKVIFNTAYYNIGNCYSTSTGYFTCPVTGYYFISFTYYSNSSTTSQRSAIMVNDNMIVMHNGGLGRSLSTIHKCNAGDKISAGSYHNNYTINFYASSGHNQFCVFLIAKA